jgi:hypothetical protein
VLDDTLEVRDNFGVVFSLSVIEGIVVPGVSVE